MTDKSPSRRRVVASVPATADAEAAPAVTASEGLVIGIGASAGGLEALDAFFLNLPSDTSLTFVVISHSPSGRVSLLPELLAARTALPVVKIEGDDPVQPLPGHVYLSARGEQLLFREGGLVSVAAVEGAPRPMIDTFFRSLAHDLRERAVGIVLSGTGSDGTLGLKEIKGHGGMTMAQEETSAKYTSMPHSAIASLQVDYVLHPTEMPRQLLAFAGTAARRGTVLTEEVATTAELFSRLFVTLRARTGHDFSNYKGSTIRRRIERRMNVHQMESLQDYLQFLQSNPAEVDKLFKELLIGVTSFFRDAEAHEILANRVLPELLADKPEGYVLRVWAAGCSTGEEAYSIAILIKEAIEATNAKVGVQIFATDLDPDAIEIARAGEYAESIAADVGPHRLERYFTREEGYFQIKKEIREMLIFAPHSLVEDPPFTKLDLLSCRNLLIYLEGKLQQQLIPIFHYSLRPGGVLFLGSSESLGAFSHLFEPIDKKWKLFRRRNVPAGSYSTDMPSAPSELGARELAVTVAAKSVDLGLSQGAERTLLNHLVPPSIIMHERGAIVHIHGRTGQFLEPAPGAQASANVYNMAREGLQLDLAVAVRHASSSLEPVFRRGVRVKSNGHAISVDLRVQKLAHPEHMRGLFLVAFERAEPLTAEAPRPDLDRSGEEVGARVLELEGELEHVKEVHQSTIEELETANEELKSTNEELQSTNEELQSANEELETSKEEMQSLNEELQTVNSELQGKVEELSRANDDMKNLLNGTDIATIFLDRDLNIKRYTDQAKKVIRLIPSDVGRPVGDLVSKLRYSALVDDAEQVLHTLVFKEAEVQSEEGAWYLMRMLPYRTTDNVIDGLVVTFVDVTKVKGLQDEASRLVRVLGKSATGIFEQRADLSYEWAFGAIFGQPSREVVGRTEESVLGSGGAELMALKREVLTTGRPLRRQLRLGRPGDERLHDVYVAPILAGPGQVTGLQGVLTALEGGDLG